MDGSKKNKLFKGLRSKGKTDQNQDSEVSEGGVCNAPDPAISKPDPEAGNESAGEKAHAADIAEQNQRDRVYQLYCKWCQYEGKVPGDDLFSQWMQEQAVAENDPDSKNTALQIKVFSMRLSSEANKVLQQIQTAEPRSEEADEESEKETAVPPDLDSAVHIYIPQGNMTAFLCAFPPFGAGEPMDRERLENALTEKGVTYGVRQVILDMIADEQLYFQIFTVALGTPPVAGKDGSVIEHIPREEAVSFEEDPDGKVDYRNLNLFRNIKKGDVICDIIPPAEGTAGTDVKGETVPPPKGKEPFIPAGKHTVLSQDGAQLLADSDGFVSFKQGNFCVESRLVIPGNVDMSVGNLDFLGDILVCGDVISGFRLNATGDIHVQGRVEGAVLTAGENIKIDEGMNGSNRGELRAGKSIHSIFLENVKVYAEEVHVQSIISCEVYCNGSIYVDKGIGAIIGGKLMAAKTVVANVIGSKAQRKTDIVLGMPPEATAQNDDKIKELDTTKKTRSLLKKNIEFLKKSKSLSDEKAAILSQLIEQEQLYEMKEQELEKEISGFSNQIIDYSQCYVRVGMVFPPTKITIGGRAYTFDAVSTKCRLYLSQEGEIVMGTDSL